mmetsp:Transcript_50631/g.93636  ORF Transcript_50631/g.93636 Transcript_50631/m.93636 type:complete len:133 (+) Transcript_50631:514-912(+)
MNVAWSCAKSSANSVASLYMPFVSCTTHSYYSASRNSAAFKEVIHKCSSLAGLDGDLVLDCANSPRGRELLKSQAKLTVPHPAVPYVLVDGKELEDTDCFDCSSGILNAVCEAWELRHSAPHSVCEAILGKT